MRSTEPRPRGRTRDTRSGGRPPREPRRGRRRRPTWTVLTLAAAVGIAACGSPAGPGDPATTTTYLLIDNWAARAVSILSSEGGSADLAFQANVSLGADVTPCGMAIGPDGRVYVTDFEGGRVLVVDRDELLDGVGTGGARLATIGLDGLAEPCGIAFDAAGAMWVADRQGSTLDASQPNWLAQFAASEVAAASGTVSLAPVRTLQLEHTTIGVTPETILPSWWISSLAFDGQGRLWFTDWWRWTVGRIDDPGSHGTGLVTDVVVDMQLTFVQGQDGQPPIQFLRNPSSLAFDGAGNVYIGMNGAPTALRYGFDALPSTGRRSNLPTATLTLPIPQGDSVFGPIGVSIDEDGTLWAASNNGRLLHGVSEPAALDGTVTPDVTTTWSDAGFTRGGSLVWTSRTTP